MLEAFAPITEQSIGKAILTDDSQALQACLAKDAGARTSFHRAPAPYDQQLWLPIHLAAHTNASEVLTQLLDAGSQVDSRTRAFSPFAGRQTALMLALLSAGQSAVNVLLTRKTDVNVQDAAGNTPLAYAIQANNHHAVQQLIDADASIAQNNYQGDTPLTIAVESKQWPIAKLLLDAGADISQIKPHQPQHFSLLHSMVRMGTDALPFAEQLKAHADWGKLCELSDPLDQQTACALAQQLQDTSWVKLLSE